MESGPVGMIKPAAGAPLSAEQIETRMRMNPDGVETSESLVSQVYRDSAGRVKIEWQLEEESHMPARLAYLLDPVASCSYILMLDQKVALRTCGAGALHVGFPALNPNTSSDKVSGTTKALGRRLVNGIEAEGSLTVTSNREIPAVSTVEEWVATSLNATLLMCASAPGWKHTAEIKNVIRHEPDQSLFVIPVSFTVQD